jgi:hypothetical protein
MRSTAFPIVIRRHEQVQAHPVGGILAQAQRLIQYGTLSLIPGLEGIGSATQISQLASREFGIPHGAHYGFIRAAIVNTLANITNNIVSYEYGLNS